ncbi:MAG: hypothetical protein JJ891_01820 [Rhizobiaceae bacterium]|nr:hypothetical protein [Rhizobiaceae bacterium]
MNNVLPLCILCKEPIPTRTKPEHILLNALGGRKTVSKIICPNCNHLMGIGPDNDLAESTKYIRNMCNMTCGDGDPAPQIRGHRGPSDLNLNLNPGMQIKAASKNALEISFEDDGVTVKIIAFSEQEAERLADAAARKIAKWIGIRNGDDIAKMKAEILENRRSHYEPAPKIVGDIEFGKGEAVRSKAKACLVLLGHAMGNEHALSMKYDKIRSFVLDGKLSGYKPEDFVILDSRPLPEGIPEKYGTHPNLVCVAGKEHGPVCGYFRLYGSIGWQLKLSCEPTGYEGVTCLVSNPFNPISWDVLHNDHSPLSSRWVSKNLFAEEFDFGAVTTKLDEIVRYAGTVSKDLWLLNLVKQGLDEAGCKEGDVITEEQLAHLARFVSVPLVSLMTRKSVPKF